jgi:hypothetical protein
MDKDFGLLNDDEVLFVRAGRILMANPTFKVSEFLDALAQLISEQEGTWSDEQEGWFNDRGQACEVLRFGNQGWQRGRVRIRLEFAPERPQKLLQDSIQPREETYRRASLQPRRDDPYRRGTREDIYQRGGPSQSDTYQWNNPEEIYPADILPDDEDY